ncbi:MAG: hypothetical protein ABIL09_18635, partial [Gemmatimonadota bacterium]
MAATALPPTGLLCQLLARPGLTTIRSARPRFGWIVNDRAAGTCQSAFQVLVATDLDALLRGRGEVWDSG